tara:strand:+ start:50 stop:463 length:414 start_codon:yes stop_codon:yes gene_type:complete
LESEALNGYAFILDIDDSGIPYIYCYGVTTMTFKWCHGPNCHTNKTVDRIRGSKGNKVLRTRKITENQWNKNSVWSVFCSQGCYTDFFYKHWQEVIAIAPRREALETKIEDPKKETTTHSWGSYNNWTIEKKAVDNA